MNEALNIQGQGETLVLLHGWGMNARVWGEFADALAQHYRVVFLELPGHGKNIYHETLDMDAFAQQMQQQINAPVHWLGWSLGGSFLIRLATLYPQSVSTLTLIASSPCFVQRQGWLPAMKADVLQQFSEALQQDCKKTLLRFIALQAMSADTGNETLKQLRKNMSDSPLPDSRALEDGLVILRDSDLRLAFEALQCPVHVVLGQDDKLVPQSVKEYFIQSRPETQADIIKGAGHAPFISHAAQTAGLVRQFIQAHQT